MHELRSSDGKYACVIQPTTDGTPTLRVPQAGPDGRYDDLCSLQADQLFAALFEPVCCRTLRQRSRTAGNPSMTASPSDPEPTERKFPGESGMANKPLKAFRDLKSFYNDNPARLSSPEADYGAHWRLDGWSGTWRVSYVRNTGEVYAVRQGPYCMGTLPTGETFVSPGQGESPVLVLGIFPPDPDAGPADIYYRGLDAHLKEWPRRSFQPDGLKWLMDRMTKSADRR